MEDKIEVRTVGGDAQQLLPANTEFFELHPGRNMAALSDINHPIFSCRGSYCYPGLHNNGADPAKEGGVQINIT